MTTGWRRACYFRLTGFVAEKGSPHRDQSPSACSCRPLGLSSAGQIHLFGSVVLFTCRLSKMKRAVARVQNASRQQKRSLGSTNAARLTMARHNALRPMQSIQDVSQDLGILFYTGREATDANPNQSQDQRHPQQPRNQQRRCIPKSRAKKIWLRSASPLCRQPT